MPKHEPLTPKAISKRIKSKGLQKLKWYCQMCQKQCRDENGFKCHTTSEAHQRQLLLFAENPGRYMDDFSSEFLKDFMHLLKTRFGTRRVHANQVYQEYIKDRHHLHMNSTRWVTLSGLVKWLGKKGLATVDCTEKGWFITYIDRDPETLKLQSDLAKKVKMEKDYEERMEKIIEEQIDRGKKQEKIKNSFESTELKRDNEEKKIVFSFGKKKSTKPVIEKHDLSSLASTSSSISSPPSSSPSSFLLSTNTLVSKRKLVNNVEKLKKKSALDEIIEEQEKLKAKKNRRENWICSDIFVRISTNKLGEKYYKKLAIIERVEDKFVAVVKMIDSGDVLKLDQTHLKTVLPKIGGKLKVVNGAYINCEATLLEANEDTYTIQIESGVYFGRIIKGMKVHEISQRR